MGDGQRAGRPGGGGAAGPLEVGGKVGQEGEAGLQGRWRRLYGSRPCAGLDPARHCLLATAVR